MSKRRQITWSANDPGPAKVLPPPLYVHAEEIPKELAEQFTPGCLCFLNEQLEDLAPERYSRPHELKYLVSSTLSPSQMKWYYTTKFFLKGTPTVFLGTTRVIERNGKIEITIPRPVFLIAGQRWMARSLKHFTLDNPC